MHSGTVKAERSSAASRGGSGSSFFDQESRACIFSSRPSARNWRSTFSIDGGSPAGSAVITVEQYSDRGGIPAGAAPRLRRAHGRVIFDR